MNGSQLALLIGRAMPVLEEARDELIDLDGAIGDGDLGITVADGARAIATALKGTTESSPADVLRTAARCFGSANPSTLAALVASGLLAAARAVEGSGDLERASAVSIGHAAAEMIAKRGGAEPGDKTILDALLPSIDALDAANGHAELALEAMIDAAEEGVARTQSLQGQRGRSAWVGERGIGHADAGATAYLRFLQALAQTWNQPEIEGRRR